MIEAQRVAVLRNRSRPPQYHFYSSRKFPRAERLGDVIVRAHLETDQLVDLISAGRKHDDRRSGKRADAPADLHSVQTRQHQVQHVEIRLEAIVWLHAI